LVASRAAVLAAVLPADVDRTQFMHAMGIHGDPVEAKRRIAIADRKGERLGKDAYGYPRAFSHTPDTADRAWMADNMVSNQMVILDPTAGGGAIPFEAARLGFSVLANDLNPVAALIEKATIEYPLSHGAALRPAFEELGAEFTKRVRARLHSTFPEESDKNTKPDGYLWARTIRCPYCEGLVPLAPNWRLAPDGTGVRLRPYLGTGPGDASRRCDFTIVTKAEEQSKGTVADGDGTCPFPDCSRVIGGDQIKEQAQSGKMGEQLFVVVIKRRVEVKNKAGKAGRAKWVTGYRAPSREDDNSGAIAVRLAEKLAEWHALDLVPSESIGALSNYDRGHRMYGMEKWADMFSPRQLLSHGTAVEVYRELLSEHEAEGSLTELKKAAFVYLSIAFDKFLNWNARQTSWNVNLESMRSVFDTHNFSMKWTFAEMAPLIPGLGYDWVIGQVGKGIGELVDLTLPQLSRDLDLFSSADHEVVEKSNIVITCKPGDALDHVENGTVDVVVMDPPYYDNVMYAELSDFFYVWLKRTAGHVVPELFTRQLTDKDNEAVANAAKFAGEKGAKTLAGRDYQERMARIFEECRRVMKPSGIMTLGSGLISATRR
jgi:adenine-specific DNA methylase